MPFFLLVFFGRREEDHFGDLEAVLLLLEPLLEIQRRHHFLILLRIGDLLENLPVLHIAVNNRPVIGPEIKLALLVPETKTRQIRHVVLARLIRREVQKDVLQLARHPVVNTDIVSIQGYYERLTW